MNNKEYELTNVEIYKKGDLKGYINGYVKFSNGREHEFLYRIDDKANGEDFTLVSIDYGYENPLVAKYWDDIEKECKELALKAS